MKEGRCVFCGGVLELLPNTQPGRLETCPHCHGDLHVCRQCRHHHAGYRNECREPRAELVVEKDRANFCEWFEFQGGTGAIDSEHQRAQAAKQRLKELFK